ncbi:TetR/AcrR family transcriptional regulator [Catenuloplanes japonicus]|uniref:TetR/AcrR family transcriptional regulator n=1 Tax=Catenuloplanes japonicus TaxID=33876 RepID=UPI000526E44E|nr:TetR/AcrR family transcriptional regulator [Catenuloplanes japonicus]
MLPAEDQPATTRRRDAAATRQLLLDAARRRFARNGYAATTVREIADQAGVNVALISRYFVSKEGLFEACLMGAADELDRVVQKDYSIDAVAASMARHLAGPSADWQAQQVLMLLRSSGDEQADRIRHAKLRFLAERMATAGGWYPGHPEEETLLLRAQVALAAALGLAILRTSAVLEPLASADQEALTEPLRAVMGALLTPQA